MKKQVYTAPMMKVQKIELQRMIATSGPQNVYSDEANGISSESDVLSRQGNSLWDDED